MALCLEMEIVQGSGRVSRIFGGVSRVGIVHVYIHSCFVEVFRYFGTLVSDDYEYYMIIRTLSVWNI